MVFSLRHHLMPFVSLIALAVTMTAPVGAAAADAAGPALTASDLSSALAADGTFIGNPDVQGTVDTSAWRLVSDLTVGEAPRFAPADSVTVSGSPTEWYALGSNNALDGALNQYVYAIAVLGSDLYVGGAFTDARTISNADYLARWDGTDWHAVGNDGFSGPALNGNVNTLKVSGTNLIVGGQFANAGGEDAADEVAVWDGSDWAPLDANEGGNGVLNGAVQAIATSGTDVYLGGSFTNVDGIDQADYVARWDGTNWHQLGSNTGNTDGALNAYVEALAISGGVVYAGGNFQNAGGNTAADYVARFNGTNWSGLGASGPAAGLVTNYVSALIFFGGQLYAGGGFQNVAGIDGADYIARWNPGTDSWSAVGSSLVPALTQAAYAFAISGSELIVGGQFSNAAGVNEADFIARWNGSDWLALGSNGSSNGALTGQVYAVAAAAGDVYAGGAFPNAAGIPEADYVARWTPPPPPTNYQPDGRIKKGSGVLVGNNIYNTDGTNQTRTGSAARGNTITFTISIQDDGDTADRFTVAATGGATTKYTVRYFRGTTEITSAVVAGTYLTPVIAVGGKLAITAKVKVKSTATVGSSVTRLVTLTSVGDSGQVDAVKFMGKRK